jgi:hypothetical protein
MAWIYGVFPSRVIGGAVLTRINRRSTPCVDALRSGAMNPDGLLRLGVNVGRSGCAVVAQASAGVAALRAVSTHGVDLRWNVAGFCSGGMQAHPIVDPRHAWMLSVRRHEPRTVFFGRG